MILLGRKRLRRGMSLVEVMISTALSAALLTAAGAAWSASTQAVEINDQVFRCAQAARVAIGQMCTEVRRCQAIQTATDHLDVITFDNHTWTYQYSATTQQLLLIDKAVTPNVTHVLANNVSAASFASDSAPNPQTQILCVVHVAMSVTISAGSTSVTLAGSAAPRININY